MILIFIRSDIRTQRICWKIICPISTYKKDSDTNLLILHWMFTGICRMPDETLKMINWQGFTGTNFCLKQPQNYDDIRVFPANVAFLLPFRINWAEIFPNKTKNFRNHSRKFFFINPFTARLFLISWSFLQRQLQLQRLLRPSDCCPFKSHATMQQLVLKNDFKTRSNFKKQEHCPKHSPLHQNL